MKGYSEPKKKKYQNYEYYVLFPKEDGERGRKWFKTLFEAQDFSARGNIAMANAGYKVAGMLEKDKRDYLDAQQLLNPYEISVLDAVKEYVDARKKLAPYKKTLPQCVKHFEKWNTIKGTSKTLYEAYGLYLDNLQATGKSNLCYRNYKNMLLRFVHDMGEKYIVGLITPKHCNDWLNALTRIEGHGKNKTVTRFKVSPETRNLHRGVLSAFFSYCIMQGYCEVNPILKVPTSKIVPEEISYYKVSDVRSILNAAKNEAPDIRLYFAIGFFAGLRRSEIMRLDYSDIDLTNKTILLPAKKTKTNRKRAVGINDVLFAWLLPYTTNILGGGQIFPKPHGFYLRLRKFMKAHRVNFLKNGLRHSFGTYFFALTSNEYETAKQMGNSPDVAKNHYANQRVTKADAEEYFNIYPDGGDFAELGKFVHSA